MCQWFINSQEHTFAEWSIHLPGDEARTLMIMRWSDAN